jgi:recombinational DNA repair ATPase RecF
MKTILNERTVKFNFKNVDDRRFYLERLIAQVNNDLLNPELKPMDRSRYFNIVISGVKLIHEMDKDATLEDLEERLAELEEQYDKARSKGSHVY